MPIVGSLILPDFMVPSRNKSLDSRSNHHLHAPHKISYPEGWRIGETEEWYKSQPTTKFTHLQYRKERDSPFYHEFILLELDNDTFAALIVEAMSVLARARSTSRSG
ncbi:hypothetical protein FRC12_024723 [Ceratobasidium sp. 428]|nr:hypothetical protein FRC12_024723 [Ceratobasidium sp. 428]